MHFPFVSGVSVRATQAGDSDGIHHKFFPAPFPPRRAGGKQAERNSTKDGGRKVVKVKASAAAAAALPRVLSVAAERRRTSRRGKTELRGSGGYLLALLISSQPLDETEPSGAPLSVC